MQKAKSLPENWIPVRSKNHPNMIYYYNVQTKKSTWESPQKAKTTNGKNRLSESPKAMPKKIEEDTKSTKEKKKKNANLKTPKSPKPKQEDIDAIMEILRRRKVDEKTSDNAPSKKAKTSKNTPPKKVKVLLPTPTKAKAPKTMPPKKSKTSQATPPSIIKKEAAVMQTVCGALREVVKVPLESPKGPEHKAMDVDTQIIRKDQTLGTPVDSIQDIEMEDVSITLHANQEKALDRDAFYIVIDTNILLYDMERVEALLDTRLRGGRLPHLYIPWTVIAELDHLKSSSDSKKSREAAKAVQHIYRLLSSKHPRTHGQTPKQAAEQLKSTHANNDDKILECCMDLTSSLPNVILLTNDVNLRSKALISNVATDSLNSFLKKENISNNRPEPMPRKIKVRSIDSVINDVKVILESVLKPLFEKEMLEGYGDIWQRIAEPPYTLARILRFMDRFWWLLFELYFGKSLKGQILHLGDILSRHPSYLRDEQNCIKLFDSIDAVFRHISFASPDQNIPMDRLAELQAECYKMFKEEALVKSSATTVAVEACALHVFEYIWNNVNNICGSLCELYGVPYDGTYDRLKNLKEPEIQHIVNRLYPMLKETKECLVLVITSKSEGALAQLHRALVNFVSFLQCGEFRPPLQDFTIDVLRNFCLNPLHRNKLEIGCNQLDMFDSKLKLSVEAAATKFPVL